LDDLAAPLRFQVSAITPALGEDSAPAQAVPLRAVAKASDPAGRRRHALVLNRTGTTRVAA
jgi:hypothetical protein